MINYARKTVLTKAIFLPKSNTFENLVIKELKIEYFCSNDQYFLGSLVVIIMEFWNKYGILGNFRKLFYHDVPLLSLLTEGSLCYCLLQPLNFLRSSAYPLTPLFLQGKHSRHPCKCYTIQSSTVDSFLTDASIRQTPRVGPCLSLLLLFDSL